MNSAVQGSLALRGRVGGAFRPREVLMLSHRFLRRQFPNQGKPPICPPAKRILYKVVDADWMRPDHVRQLLWRRHVYNNAMVSIRQLFREEVLQREKAGLGIETLKMQEMEELNHLIELNDQRNAKSREKRAEREKVELEEIKAETLAQIERMLKETAENVAKRSEEVKEMIRLSEEFVTPENLERRIIEALESPIVYDFAIDLEAKRTPAMKPVKYVEGVPTRQKARLYDRSHTQKI